MRRVIQISQSESGADVPSLVALCSDGTMWLHCLEGPKAGWELIPNVPSGSVNHVVNHGYEY